VVWSCWLAVSYFKLGQGKKAVCACYLFSTPCRCWGPGAGAAMGNLAIDVSPRQRQFTFYPERRAIINGSFPVKVPMEYAD